MKTELKSQLINLASQLISENCYETDCYGFFSLFKAQEIVTCKDKMGKKTATALAKEIEKTYGYLPLIRVVEYDLTKSQNYWDYFAKEKFVEESIIVIGKMAYQNVAMLRNEFSSEKAFPQRCCVIEDFWADKIETNIKSAWYEAPRNPIKPENPQSFRGFGIKRLQQTDGIVVFSSNLSSLEYAAYLYHEHYQQYNEHPRILIYNDRDGKNSPEYSLFMARKMREILKKMYVNPVKICIYDMDLEYVFSSNETKQHFIVLLSPRKSYVPKKLKKSPCSLCYYMVEEDWYGVMRSFSDAELKEYLYDVNLLIEEIGTFATSYFRELYDIFRKERHTKFACKYRLFWDKACLTLLFPIVISDWKRAIKQCYKL